MLMPTSTLKSIAESTGFSVTTVSRALGGYDDVNEHTRQLILAEAKRQNYQPNLNARNLKGQQSQTIGLVIPTDETRSYDDPFFSMFIAGIGNRAAQDAFNLLLSVHPPDAASELDAYNRLINGHNVDGMILVRIREGDPRIRLLQKLKVPFVVFGRANITNSFTYIDVDGTRAQRELTGHLIENGHRKIAFLAPPRHLSFSKYRLDGFRAAMQAAGEDVREEWVIFVDTMTESGGRAAAEALLSSSPHPTAIMTGNDRMALGVIAAVHQRGLSVGEDVAVTGFDNIPAAEHIYPGLTTMHQPTYEIGEQLADQLLGTIAGSPPENPATILTAKLIVRGSTVPNAPNTADGNT